MNKNTDITASDIENRRIAAGGHGDDLMVRLCSAAIKAGPGTRAWRSVEQTIQAERAAAAWHARKAAS